MDAALGLFATVLPRVAVAARLEVHPMKHRALVLVCALGVAGGVLIPPDGRAQAQGLRRGPTEVVILNQTGVTIPARTSATTPSKLELPITGTLNAAIGRTAECLLKVPFKRLGGGVVTGGFFNHLDLKLPFQCTYVDPPCGGGTDKPCLQIASLAPFSYAGVSVIGSQTLPCNDCDPNASCDDSQGAALCRCDEGFSGDGVTCVPDLSTCSDGIDNDGNGLQDCAEPACAGLCGCPEGFNGEGGTCAPYPPACSDGIDNDGNGLQDCADPACASVPCDESGSVCQGGECVPAVANLRVENIGDGTGRVAGTAVNQSFSCDFTGPTSPQPCTATVPTGTLVFLNAAAFPGSTFGGWTGCDQVDGPRCVTTPLGDTTVFVTFRRSP